jgi:hypothetical protein
MKIQMHSVQFASANFFKNKEGYNPFIQFCPDLSQRVFNSLIGLKLFPLKGNIWKKKIEIIRN